MQLHQWYLLKLANYIKVECLYEVIFFLCSIAHPIPPPHHHFRWEVEPYSKLSKKEALTGSQILEEVDGKERCDLFQGELQKLKSEIFNDKRSL